jgi:hypothetical protein
MASSRDLRDELLNTLTRKIPNRGMLRQIIVVEIS